MIFTLGFWSHSNKTARHVVRVACAFVMPPPVNTNQLIKSTSILNSFCSTDWRSKQLLQQGHMDFGQQSRVPLVQKSGRKIINGEWSESQLIATIYN